MPVHPLRLWVFFALKKGEHPCREAILRGFEKIDSNITIIYAKVSSHLHFAHEDDMKKLSSLAIVLITLAILYTGHWFYNANGLKTLVTNHLKEYEKIGPDGYQFKVDDVSVGGFPFNYEVNFVKPRYALAKESVHSSNETEFFVDGAMKIGTDILGRRYWVKQQGDIHYTIPEGNENKEYLVKGNMEFEVDATQPQLMQAFLHPFHGLPPALYQEEPSFHEILQEIHLVSYRDHNFSLFEVTENGNKPLLSFSNGSLICSHRPTAKNDQKYVFSFNMKDLETPENGKFLIPHLLKLMQINPSVVIDHYSIFGSGKNNLSIEFETIVPQNFDFTTEMAYKNVELNLKKMEIDNLYGNSSIQSLLSIVDIENEQKKLHLDFDYETQMTQLGLEATQRELVHRLKLDAAAAASKNDPDEEIYTALLECCQNGLGMIPDFTKLGKMKIVVNVDALQNIGTGDTLNLKELSIKHCDIITEPYAIKSHGEVKFVQDLPHGKYEIVWENYQKMLHDIFAYYNRIFPVLKKMIELREYPIPLEMIKESEEEGLVSFFRLISNDPEGSGETITITVDFNDLSNITVGGTSLQQVIEASHKL
jgi:hypothetical protein